LVLPSAADRHAALIRALRARAILWFRERVVEYCLRLGVAVPRVGLSSARTRWGSCSAHSGIRLHWRLIHLSPALIDYVVAHEVAHLVEMNHSPSFWSLVEKIYPDWKSARKALRDAACLLPLIVPGDEGVALKEN
jgi:predicted metal-dependent hydrolase